MTNRVLAVLSIFAVILTVWSHAHSNEPPHLKYSKAVNEKAAEEVASGHVHSHDHGHHHHHHDHNHDHHGHDHDHFHGHDHDHHHHGHDHSHDHDHHHGHDHGHHHHHHDHEELLSHGHHHHHHGHAAASEKNKFVPYDKNSMFAFLNDPQTRLWTYSVGATVLISAVPFLILIFIPIQANTSESGNLLKVLLAFGAGGLLGDAFLHLIPHASGGHDHGHDHGHGHHHHHHHGEEGHDHVHDMSVGLWVLGGLLTFFLVEKFVRIVRGEDEHCHGGHSHSHGAAPQPFSKPNPPPAKKAKSSADETDDEKSDRSVKKDKELKKRPVKKETVAERRASMSEKKEQQVAAAAVAPRIKVAAYLNLAADFMHNFTDGLAIGASFIAGTTVGVVTMWTVLFHEVPHEIGDFAILIQSGYSKRRAMFTQLLTAFGAIAGCCISLYSVDAYALAEAAQSSWVLPFTAGGFIYIAAVSVLPELLEKSSFLLSIFEVIALAAGVFSMYLVALYE